MKSLIKFLKREDGPTAVEYAVMLALIIVACIGAITTLGTTANDTFNKVNSGTGAPREGLLRPSRRERPQVGQRQVELRVEAERFPWLAGPRQDFLRAEAGCQ